MGKQPGITSAQSFIRRSPPAAGCCSGSLKNRRCIWPGIATMEDLIESVMGNIQDEYDQEEDEVLPLEEGGYSFDGGVQLELVERLLETDLEADEDTDTLGGLIANTLGRIPGDGENPSVTIAGVEFTVLLAEDRRIMRVQARRVPLPADEPVGEES